jgi:hypothetical protein
LGENSDRSTAGGAGKVSGGGRSPERERRGRREREKRKKGSHGLHCPPVVPTRLAWLSRIDCSSATGGHMAQHGWASSRARVDGMTMPHHKQWHD